MYTYLISDTQDELLLPVAVFDTLVESASFIGCTPQWLSSMLKRYNVAVVNGFLINRFLSKELDKIS